MLPVGQSWVSERKRLAKGHPSSCPRGRPGGTNRLQQRDAGAPPRKKQATSQGWKAFIPVQRAGGSKESPRDRVSHEPGNDPPESSQVQRARGLSQEA